jgi:predicted O-methyltransferase YrrM
MTPHTVKDTLGDLPRMGLRQAKRLTQLLTEHDLRDCLELGFSRGVSSCYIAAALQEMGGGSLVTIDLISAKDKRPNIEENLTRLALREFVTVHYEPVSYTWRLMRLLQEHPQPRFDFCYIDGAHTWAVDGLAFFLVERLLRPGGWILFDDMNWTFAKSQTLRDSESVKAMPADERELAQVRLIWDLLVKPHPGFDTFLEENGWAFARKRRDETASMAQRRNWFGRSRHHG